MRVTLRRAARSDAGLILQLIRELAEYERMSELVKADERLITERIFDRSAAEVIIAEADGEAAGFCLYFKTFSTFLGREGIHLEDLYVREQYRGSGIGKKLLCALAKICVREGYGRLEWSCLDWNAPSRKFYRSLGAKELSEWVDYRIDGDELAALAQIDAKNS